MGAREAENETLRRSGYMRGFDSVNPTISQISELSECESCGKRVSGRRAWWHGHDGDEDCYCRPCAMMRAHILMASSISPIQPADGWDDAGFNCDGELCGGCGRRMAGGERLYFHRICIDARPVYDLCRCLECCNAEITRLKIEDVLSNETDDSDC